MSYVGGGRRPRRGRGTGPLTTVVGALDTGEAFPILAAAWSHRLAGKGSPGPVPLPRRGLRSHAGAASNNDDPGSLPGVGGRRPFIDRGTRRGRGRDRVTLYDASDRAWRSRRECLGDPAHEAPGTELHLGEAYHSARPVGNCAVSSRTGLTRHCGAAAPQWEGH